MVIREQIKGVKGCCNPLTPVKNELENVKQIAVTAKSTADQSADLIDDCIQRTAQSEIDIDNLDKSIGDLQVDIDDINTDIYSIGDRATADEVRIATNESNIVTHGQRLTALESSESTHDSEITALQSDINDIKPRLSTAETDIISLESTVGIQSTALNDLCDRMNTAESDITEHNSEIATAQDDIAVNTSEISGIKTRLTTAEGTIAGNSSSISLLQTRIQTAESDIDACEGRLTTNESNIAANASDIADVEERTSTLESDIVTVHTQLAKKQDVLTAGDNISISDSNVISATDTKYTAGDNISISDSNVISAIGVGVTAGTGLSLSGSTINHSNSVTAKTSYVGSATAIPQIKYDAQGHITGTSSVTVYPPTTAGTNGQLWTSQGSSVGKWRTPSDYNSIGNYDVTNSYSDSTWYGGYDRSYLITIRCRSSQNIQIKMTWNTTTDSWFHIYTIWDTSDSNGMSSATFILGKGRYFQIDINANRDKDTTNRFIKYPLTVNLRG